MSIQTFITNLGTALVAKSMVAEAAVKFVGAKIGTGDIGLAEDAREYENLKVYYADALLSKMTYEGGSTCKFSAQYTSSGLIEAVKIKEIGIYAEDPDHDDPILFAYTNLGEEYDTLFPADQASFYKFYDVVMVFTTSNGVSVTIAPSAIFPAKDVVNTPEAGKVLRLDSNGKLPGSITGDAGTLGGHDAAYFSNSEHRHDNAVAGAGAKDGFMSKEDKAAHDTLVSRVNQALLTNSSPTFANLTVNGNISGATFL